MGWKEQLRPASFRSVGFFVDSAELEAGRDFQVHSAPHRDQHYVEDVGRKVRRYTVRGYIIGDDYLREKDRLIAACERRSPAWPYRATSQLIHPYFGVVRCACESVRTTESRLEGGFVGFVATFVETEELVTPAPTLDAGSLADEAAESIAESSGATVIAGLSTEGIGIPESVRASTTAALQSLSARLARLTTVRGLALDVEEFGAAVASLESTSGELATSPLDLVTATRSTLDLIFGTGANAIDSLFAYEEVLGLDLSSIKPTGSSGASQLAGANVDLISGLAHQLAFAGALRSIARVDFDSLDSAIARRDSLVSRIESELESAGYDVYRDLQEGLRVLVETVPSSGSSLPRLVSIRLAESEPSLVVAHRLYEDARRGREIADRNAIPRPGFLPGGVTLQVLSE